MAELEKLDIYACALPMPTPEEPVLTKWLHEIERVVEREKDDEIYLVGHSLGVPTILHFLEKTNRNISGALLVAGPSSMLDNEKVNRFLQGEFDFEKIKSVCPRFAIIHGDNDQKVPFSHAEFLKEHLSCNLVSIKNGGHLNGSSGWLSLPEALTELKKMMNID